MESEEEGEIPNYSSYDEFEEEMDNFWKDENPETQLMEEASDYFEEEEESLFGEDVEIEGILAQDEEEEQINEEEIDKILAQEQEQLLKENGLVEAIEEIQGPEKIILDRLNVEKLINMISKVRLVWPQDLPYYNEAEYGTDPERAKFPESFYHCTDKEKTVMWHAENFRRQYHFHFPKRRPMLIALKNECGCQKLLPTFINPCILGYPDFLDCMSCAKFLKDFLAPEMMEHPTRVPDIIRSHVTVLKERKANCYEFAIITVTFLTGAGYDAYVVDGYASETVCKMDATEDYVEEPEVPALQKRKLTKKKSITKESEQSNKINNMDFYNLLPSRNEEENVIRPVSPSKYRFSKPVSIVSQHEVEPQAQKQDSHLTLVASAHSDLMHSDVDEGHEDHENEQGDEDEEEGEEIKPPASTTAKKNEKYYGMRTHAWVLILPGKRDVEQSFFLEPFSGSKFEMNDENFHGIEAVYNQKNFYVNLQDNSVGLGELSYDLNDSSKWSKLLVEAEKKKKTQEEQESLFQDEEDDVPKKAELLLEMPVSWTTDPDIPPEDYERKYPGGKKTFNYNDAIVELAAPYVNDDGLVKKVLKFDGPGRNPENLLYIEEFFEHRKDKLSKRKWIRQGRMLYENFEKGRRDALKEHVHISGKNKPNYPRDLYYYSNAHPQNVAHRQIIRKGMIEHFEERDDLLYYRFTSYGGVLCDITKPKSEEEAVSQSKAKQFLEMLKGDNSGPGAKKRVRRKLNKIIEKYHRNESKDSTDDVAEKYMLMDEGRLRVLFHYGEGNLTRNTLEFFKPRGCNVDTTDFKPEDCNEYQADRHAELMNVYRKFKLLQRMEADQRVASVLAVQAEDEVYQTVTNRVQEDWRHEIEPDAFAGDRNEEYIKMKEQKVVDDEDEEDDLTGIDFVSPFLEKYGNPRNTPDEVIMKKRIMLNAKVKLVKRAHAIRDSYERASAQLKEKMAWHERHMDKLTPTQEEDFSHMYKERLFAMHIMEKRLSKHQELASKKYYAVLLDVLKHPILNKYSRKVPPPKPVVVEMSEEEKARLARELAKARDCCQFYTMKYVEPKKEEKKPEEIKTGASEQQLLPPPPAINA